MIVSVLKNIYKKINYKAVNGVNEERMPYGEQMKYLRHFPEPRDDYERSFFKYKCFCEYCYYKKKWVIAVYNIGAMLILPFVHSKLKREGQRKKLIKKVDMVIENVPRLPNKDIIPNDLLERYQTVEEIKAINYSESFLSETSEGIYKELRNRYFFHFYFRMIVLQKLGQFSSYIVNYQPRAIAFYGCEREFPGPLQAMLCEKCNTEYLSFMHGDYLSTLSFAFQRYTKYYVWDKSYIDMFKDLRCSPQMTIYQPRKLKGIAPPRKAEDCPFFATYYFSDETRIEADKIYEIFKNFELMGLRTKVRPHPRFSDTAMLQEVFKDIEIENPREYRLGDSVADSLYIVGLETTVLSEAFFSGKEIVIDDVSNKEKYLQLDERGYVMIKRPHILLSAFKEKINGKYDERYAFLNNRQGLAPAVK